MTSPKLLLASCLIPLALAACGNGAGVASLSIPFAVDNEFAASWYLGDGETVGPLTDGACAMRAGNRQGKCHSFTWLPVAATSYAGVYWQYPDKSYGAVAGKAIPAGAKSVSFWAWGGKGGEAVKFFAGVPIDGFNVQIGPITLTTTPTQYYLNLQNVTYTNVAAPFGWATNTQSSGGSTVINIDDIEWLDTPPVGNTAGCTDSMAANYNAGANMSDGSCLYNVTFQVDLSAVTLTANSVPQVEAAFNGYCPDNCNKLVKGTGTVWTTTLPLPIAGPAGYLFSLGNGAAGYEVVPTICSLDPSQDDQHRTRSLTVTAAQKTLPVVHFGSCN
jgi:hypothetical protein